jgi:colanic acid/amylovoran biosynthesis protein
VSTNESVRVLVVNQHGDNRGDEAALWAMLAGLEQRLGTVRFTVVHQFRNAEAGPALRPDVEWIPIRLPVVEAARLVIYLVLRVVGLRFHFVLGRLGRATIAAYEGADLVVSAPGGPYFGDLYVGHEPVHWLYVWMARLHRVPCAVYATSAGPFRRRWANPFRRFTYRSCQVVHFREAISASHLDELFAGRRRPVRATVTADSALQIDVAPAERDPGRRLVVVSAIDLPYRDDPDPPGRRHRYDAAVAACVARLADGRPTDIVLVPQLYSAKHRDAPYLERLAVLIEARLGSGSVTVLDEHTPMLEQRALFAAADFVVAGRYHPAVFALSSGVPQVCIPYEHKATGLLALGGLDDLVVPLDEVSEARLVEAAERLLREADEVRARTRVAATQLRSVAAQTSDAVAAMLEARPASGRQG